MARRGIKSIVAKTVYPYGFDSNGKLNEKTHQNEAQQLKPFHVHSSGLAKFVFHRIKYVCHVPSMNNQCHPDSVTGFSSLAHFHLNKEFRGLV